jgi:hypothetical protein
MTMQQEKIRTIHVYFEEEDEQPEEEELSTIIDADPQSEPETKPYSKPLGMICGVFFCLLCIAVLILATMLPQIYPNTYDRTISRTLTLTFSQHPTTGQVQVYAFAQIKKTEQLTVSASGSLHQNATKATGLITFYNGLFTPQTVPLGITITGKDGVSVITGQQAVIPAATPTTPPTYGTVSVTAYSMIFGTLGNIVANDIDSACCGSSILAQNLYAFSGGQDAKNVPVLTKTDLSTGTQTLISQVNSAITSQEQAETKSGYILLPLDCSQTLTANHQPGNQAGAAILTLKETCTPVAYLAPDIATLAQRLFTLPQGYRLVSFTALVAQSHANAQGGTLTIRAVAYLKQNAPVVHLYHFAGK